MKQPVFEQTGFPHMPMMPKFEMDPNFSVIQFFILESNNDQAQITMKREDVRRLKLMVDEFIRVRLIPIQSGESSNFQANDSGNGSNTGASALVRAEIQGISIDSRNRSREYQKMNNKPVAEIAQQKFDFSPFANLGFTVKYLDTNHVSRIVMKKEELMQLNVTAGDTILLEISRIDSL